MKILSSVLILSESADVILLYTDLPSSMPNLTAQNLVLRFEVAYNGGRDYMAKHFPEVPVKITGRTPKP